MEFPAYIENIIFDYVDTDAIILELRINVRFSNAENIQNLILARKLKDSTPYIVEMKERKLYD